MSISLFNPGQAPALWVNFPDLRGVSLVVGARGASIS
jgi:hypothetical protein